MVLIRASLLVWAFLVLLLSHGLNGWRTTEGHFFYANKLTGETTWTRPEFTDINNLRSELELPVVPSNTRRRHTGSENGVYSDDSDVNPENFRSSMLFLSISINCHLKLSSLT